MLVILKDLYKVDMYENIRLSPKRQHCQGGCKGSGLGNKEPVRNHLPGGRTG